MYSASISGVRNPNNELFSVDKEKATYNNVSSLLTKPYLLKALTAQLLSQVPKASLHCCAAGLAQYHV